MEYSAPIGSEQCLIHQSLRTRKSARTGFETLCSFDDYENLSKFRHG